MLLELAVGDAYGTGFEYTDAETVDRENDPISLDQQPMARRPGP